MSIFTWGMQSLVSAKPEESKNERYNPRPPGVIREGSVTHAVWHFLNANRGKWYSRYQILNNIGCTDKSADWACLFLKEQGLIESCPDHRNSRYLRYAVTTKNPSAQISEPRSQASEKGLARDEAPMPGAGVQGLVTVRRSGDSDAGWW
ncbi:MAG: hypothetical protein FGM44_05735 [Limnohabitans sp.]|nr:hypothetical protein [Limnohabitans sp.]